MPSRFRLTVQVAISVVLAGCAYSGAAQVAGAPMPVIAPDAQIAAAIKQVSAAKVQADIAKLVSFGTRSTLSSMDTDLPAGHGINAAADWVESEFKAISAECGGCLEVKRDEFM